MTTQPIDQVILETEQLCVHGKNLVDLIVEHNYLEAIFHVITGKLPDPLQLERLNHYFVNSLRRLVANPSYVAYIKILRRKRFSIEQALISSFCLLSNQITTQDFAELTLLFPTLKNSLEDFAQGLRLFCSAAITIGIIQYDLSFYELPKIVKEKINFNEIILSLVCGKTSGSLNEKELLDKILIALHAGFGIVAPTIILPRFSASTYAPISMNLIAGLTGNGPAHVGACKKAMQLFKYLGQLKSLHEIENFVGEKIAKNEKIPGFGHPLLMCDPRARVLEQHALKLLTANKYFQLYKSLVNIMAEKYSLHPNIDAIVAAILLDLNTPETLGTVLFLFARLPTMIAHSIEKKSKPPFGFKRAEARERFERIPVDWI